MKYFFLFFVGAALAACNATDKKQAGGPETHDSHEVTKTATQDSASMTTIEWIDPVTQDLGTLTKGQVVEISWKFKNTGTKPLTIEDVRAGCGCTTPDKPTEPIAPGAEGVIKAKFDSQNFTGHVTKEVNVLANNSNRNNGTDNKLSFTADIK